MSRVVHLRRTHSSLLHQIPKGRGLLVECRGTDLASVPIDEVETDQSPDLISLVPVLDGVLGDNLGLDGPLGVVLVQTSNGRDGLSVGTVAEFVTLRLGEVGLRDGVLGLRGAVIERAVFHGELIRPSRSVRLWGRLLDGGRGAVEVGRRLDFGGSDDVIEGRKNDL